MPDEPRSAPGRRTPFPSADERRPPLLPPACANAWGDDAYGLWIDVDLDGVVQRCRWIEPGEFMMGSPADESKRSINEGPRHRVRLTQGFWLADTACTQALWAAVMGGKNPSAFREDGRNPVENMSWDEVRAFLQRVASLVPGVVAELPTEAEWEYACRAGSGTPFSFGTTITPDQANYDGTSRYAGGATGEYRKKTVPVKSFAPNRWGLYEMHGNVWEWCADGVRGYADETVEDPRGPEGGAPRVVRGGSWILEAWWLRSACRGGGLRASRFVTLGFRFALRSISQEREAGAERLPAASGVTRDA